MLEQGWGNKQDLINSLRHGHSSQGSQSKSGAATAAAAESGGCVLVATASLWEGIDIAGDALQLVIIDKLPFHPPGDPVVEARSQRLQAQGLSPFQHYSLPEAAVMLKQGAGRLIRTENDRGALVVCDVRLTQTRYGHRLVQSLPPMKKLGSEAEFLGYLQGLNQNPSHSGL